MLKPRAKKYLLIVVAGNESMHKRWLPPTSEYDVFVVYYGSDDRYKDDGKYYDKLRGCKLDILHQVANKHRAVIAQYDGIVAPDDDLFITQESLLKFMRLCREYDLDLAQPSICGWISLAVTAHVPNSKIRYTSNIEQMCAFFSHKAWDLCVPTFMENRSKWGIDFLWGKLLGEPKDKIAIIDEIIAIHTRPLMNGDNYKNNNNTAESSYNELLELIAKYNVPDEPIVVHKQVTQTKDEWQAVEFTQHFTPNVECMKQWVTSLRRMQAD